MATLFALVGRKVPEGTGVFTLASVAEKVCVTHTHTHTDAHTQTHTHTYA